MSHYPLHKTNLYNWECLDPESYYNKEKIYRLCIIGSINSNYIYYYKDSNFIKIDRIRLYCNSFNMANQYLYNFIKTHSYYKIPEYCFGNYFKIKKIYDK